MGVKQILVFLLALLVYFLVVYLLNKDRSNRMPYFIGLGATIVYSLFKFLGKKHGAERFFSPGFVYGILWVLIVLMYYPIFTAVYSRLKSFLDKQTYSLGNKRIIMIFAIALTVIVGYYFYVFWYNIYLYLF